MAHPNEPKPNESDKGRPRQPPRPDHDEPRDLDHEGDETDPDKGSHEPREKSDRSQR